MAKPRPVVAVAGLWHETNTFASQPTTEADFRAYQYAEKDELVERFGSVRNEVGGAIAALAAADCDIQPGFYAAAVPSGLVSAAVYAEMRRRLLESLHPRPDAVLLVLHGAMVADGIPDVEADLVEGVRRQLGDVPLVVTLDYHANLSERTSSQCDAIVAYRTYPHIDAYETGWAGADMLARTLRGEVRPVTAHIVLPLLTAPITQASESEPMRELLAAAVQIEEIPGVISVSLVPGFAFADVDRLGFSVVVVTDGDRELAERLCSELAQRVWAERERFSVAMHSPGSAVEAARASLATPLVLVDVADNVGGGAPGDGTVLLRKLLDSGIESSAVVIADAAAVEACSQAGVGAQVSLLVGARADARHGDPTPISGTVRMLTDGVFTHVGTYMTGQQTGMGRCAVVDCGGVRVAITERRTMPFDPGQLTALGIDPRHCRAIVAKAAVAWRAAFEGIEVRPIFVDTPGICSARLERLPFSRSRRLYPLDPGVTLPASPAPARA